MRLSFEKMHGLGNDFVIAVDWPEKYICSETAVHLADRNLGIGCDQFISVKHLSAGLVNMRIFNADGSESSMCGNALRCVAGLLLDTESDISIETFGQTTRCSRIGQDIALVLDRPKISKFETKLSNGLRGFEVDAGNSHFVILSDQAAHDCENYAENVNTELEGGFNISFLQVVGRRRGILRVFERGVGVTKACGSAAAACFALARELHLADLDFEIIFELGSLHLQDIGDEKISVRGGFTHVFGGTINL